MGGCLPSCGKHPPEDGRPDVMKYLLVMVLLITAFALGVVYGPRVRERVQHMQPQRIWSDWSKGVIRK
jgi:hypothetical protein